MNKKPVGYASLELHPARWDGINAFIFISLTSVPLDSSTVSALIAHALHATKKQRNVTPVQLAWGARCRLPGGSGSLLCELT